MAAGRTEDETMSQKPVNGNTPPHGYKEYIALQKKMTGGRTMMAPGYLKTPFNTRQRYLENMIWFFKFELSFSEKEREHRRNLIRSKLRVVK